MSSTLPFPAEGFGPLDLELVRALARVSGEARPDVLFALAMTSARARDGHVCVRLQELQTQALNRQVSSASLDAWTNALLASPLVIEESGRPSPLVLSRGRLYLSRFHDHELAVEARLRALSSPAPLAGTAVLARQALARWFDDPTAPAALAAMVLEWRRLAILTGGPGTGKTTAIARILALHAELFRERHGRAPKQVLLAPTGKAAARMGEAVAALAARLSEVHSAARDIPINAATLHRALGRRPAQRGSGGDGAAPLSADLVVVDEASMVDIAMFRSLLDALGPEARLLLVGDPHQLASVDAGAVLADLCAAAPASGSSELRQRWAAERFGVEVPASALPIPAPIGECVVQLTHSYRFDPSRGVGRLSRAIVDGDADAALDVLSSSSTPEAELLDDGAAPSVLDDLARAGYDAYCRAQGASARIARLGSFRVLCAHRVGPRGVERLNPRVEAVLREQGLLPSSAGLGQEYYLGRPVLITQNDTTTRLFNGDMGVVEDDEGVLRVAFAVEEQLRFVSPARLPAHETVFVMSIHKSQGSEVEEAAVVLPDASSPLCSRELLYTAVTRVKATVRLVGNEAAVRAAVAKRVERASGLADRLASS